MTMTTLDPTPVFGETLPNGARVIAANGAVIFAHTGSVQPYVTWRWNGTDLRSTWSGNYFSDLVEAAKDFGARSQKLLNRE